MKLSLDTQLALAKLLNSALTRSKLSSASAAARKLDRVRATALEDAIGRIQVAEQASVLIRSMADVLRDVNTAARVAEGVGVARAEVALILARADAFLDVLTLVEDECSWAVAA